MDGSIDLEAFTGESGIRLRGQWLFWKDRLVTPDTLDAAELKQAIRTDRLSFREMGLDPMGVGTFAIKLKNLTPGQSPLGMRLRADSAVLVFFARDTEGPRQTVQPLFTSGKLATNAEGSIPQITDPVILLDIATTGDYWLCIQIANFHYFDASIWGVPTLESYPHAYRQWLYELASESLVVGIVLALLVYYVWMFLMRRESPASLWLAAFCFFALLRVLGISGHLFALIFPDPSYTAYHLQRWLEYAPVTLSGAFLLLFIHASFRPHRSKRTIHLFTLCALGHGIVTLISPIPAYRNYLFFIDIYLFTAVIIAFHYIIEALRRRVTGSLISLLGAVLFTGTIIHDMVIGLAGAIPFDNSLFLSHYGACILMLTQGQVVARMFAKAFATNKLLIAQIREKERARTLFFHNASHELRTPLNGILGFIQLMTQGAYGEVSPKMGSQLGKVQHLANALLGQVNTILDLAKNQKGEFKLINALIPLDEIVEETRTLAESLTAKNGGSSFNIAKNWQNSDNSALLGDRDKIMTVIRNLIGNAFKFKKIGEENNVDIAFRLTTSGTLLLSITDKGIGIPDDQYAAIFEEFRQVEGDSRRAYEGTGLGLAMVKTIIDLMGGTITVKSQLQGGSQFTVEIPPQKEITLFIEPEKRLLAITASERPLPHAMANAKDPAFGFLCQPSIATKPDLTHGMSYRILVVDDNPINCEVVSDILRASDIKVDLCYSGREALARLAREKPDLILLDLMMPEVSGEDVLIHIRGDARLKDISVILLTARASQEDRLNGLGLGADDYLAKPLIAEELLLRVNNLLARIGLARAAGEKQVIEATLAETQKIYNTLGDSNTPLRNVEIANYYRSADMVGGDWFGLSYDEKRDWIYAMIGDATGHDMISALMTVATAGAVKGALETLKNVDMNRTKEECLTILAGAINAAVYETGMKIERAMSMAFLCIDLGTGSAAYLNAGHCQVMVMSHEAIHGILTPSPLLGLYQHPQFSARKLQFDKGDTIFLYTDGLIENCGPNGHRLSGRKLRSMLQSHMTDVQLLKRIILEEGGLIWSTQPAKDDCAFLIIRWNPTEICCLAA